MRIVISVVFLSLVMLPVLLPAGDLDEDDHLIDKDFKPGKPWQEQQVRLPSPPRDGNLILMDIPHSRNKYYIDARSVSVGKDRVGRYTVVIETPSGVRNIFYEGIRCGPETVRTYAYAIGNGPFNLIRNSSWKPINRSGGHVYSYREDLLTLYFCNEGRMRDSVREIVRLLRYPPEMSAPETDE